MKYALLGIGFIIVWILGVFVGNLDSRWMHMFLAVGTVLIAIGIVLGGEEGESQSG
jgi:hypothetical protein